MLFTFTADPITRIYRFQCAFYIYMNFMVNVLQVLPKFIALL